MAPFNWQIDDLKEKLKQREVFIKKGGKNINFPV